MPPSFFRRIVESVPAFRAVFEQLIAAVEGKRRTLAQPHIAR